MTERDRQESVYETGSSGARADEAAAAAPGDMKPGDDPEAREEDLLDEAVEENLPRLRSDLSRRAASEALSE